jgi:hypothetical protein
VKVGALYAYVSCKFSSGKSLRRNVEAGKVASDHRLRLSSIDVRQTTTEWTHDRAADSMRRAANAGSGMDTFETKLCR